MKQAQNILITRPKDQSQELVKFFRNHNFCTFVEPMYSVEKIDVSRRFSFAESSKFSAVIITSSNACDAVIQAQFPKDIKIFVVGKMTAKRLAKHGFTNLLIPSEESAISLKNLILETNMNQTKRIAHFHGTVMSLDFQKELKEFGFEVEKILSYQTYEVKDFSQNFLEFSHTNLFDYVLFFSKNSAEIFFKMAEKNNLLEYFRKAQLLCLSENICEDIFKKFSHIFQDLPSKKSGKKSDKKYCTIPKTFGTFPVLQKFYNQ